MKEKTVKLLREGSFDRLLRAVDNDILGWSDADIMNAPLEVVEEALEKSGIAARNPDHIPVDIEINVDDYDEENSIIRVGLIEEVAKHLYADRDIVLSGPSGMGKTHFAENCMLSAPEIRIICPKIIRIDGLALQMPSPYQIEQAAVAAFFGEDETECKAFMRNAPDKGALLTTLIETAFFAHKGLVVVDHLESFSRSSETQHWLGKLVQSVHQTGSRMMFITRGSKIDANLIHRSSRNAAWCKPPLASNENISRWLKKRNAEKSTLKRITPRRIRRFTGGWPRLMRAFTLFMQDSLHRDDPNAVLNFARIATSSFSPELAALFSVLRGHPAFLHRPLEVANPHLIAEMVETGAIVEREDGGLKFQNPIFSQRYKELSRLSSLRVMALIGQDHHILAHRGIEEITGQVLQQSLMLETHPWNTIKRILAIFRHFGLDGHLYLRDRENSKLWSQAQGLSAESAPTWPLYADKNPEFARAVQTGKLIIGDDNTVYLPNTGQRGRIDTVLEGKLSNKHLAMNAYERSVQLDMIQHIAKCLQPVLALAVERYFAITAERQRRKAIYRFRSNDAQSGSALHNILSQVGCSAIIVLERGQKSWFSSCVEQIVPSECSVADVSLKIKRSSRCIDWEKAVRTIEGDQLDSIADHPSRYGLVVRGKQLSGLFPNVGEFENDFSVFLWPEWLNQDNRCRMTAFVFAGCESHIDGWRQTHLSLIAPYAARLAH